MLAQESSIEKQHCDKAYNQSNQGSGNTAFLYRRSEKYDDILEDNKRKFGAFEVIGEEFYKLEQQITEFLVFSENIYSEDDLNVKILEIIAAFNTGCKSDLPNQEDINALIMSISNDPQFPKLAAISTNTSKHEQNYDLLLISEEGAKELDDHIGPAIILKSDGSVEIIINSKKYGIVSSTPVNLPATIDKTMLQDFYQYIRSNKTLPSVGLYDPIINSISQEIYKNKVETLVSNKVNEFKTYIIEDNSYKECFGKSLLDIDAEGSIYRLPMGTHKWKYNASWLLGHLHKGNEFVILSNITENTKTDRRGEFGPGFYREVAICYRFGYRRDLREDNQIILKHPNPDKLRTLQLKDILDISTDEKSLKDIERFYNLAISDYKITNSFVSRQRPISPS